MEKEKLTFKPNPYLEKLDKIMGYDLSDRAPSYSFVLLDGMSKASLLLSVLATPYILWLLFQLRRFGWLISFSVFVLAPFLIGTFFISDHLFRMVFIYFPLISLGIFHVLLRQTYPNWREPLFKNRPGSDFK